MKQVGAYMSRVPRKFRCRTRLMAWSIVGVGIVGALWVLGTGFLARLELLTAQKILKEIKNSALTPTATRGSAQSLDERISGTMHRAEQHAQKARQYTSGFSWKVAARLPFIGGPAETTRVSAACAERLVSQVLTPLVGAIRDMGRPSGEGGRFDIAGLQQAEPGLQSAAHTASQLQADVAKLPTQTWLPPADRARNSLSRYLEKISKMTHDAAAGAKIIPRIMGSEGPRRYLLIFQNTAEARGTGGLPGAYSIIHADKGKLEFEEFGNDIQFDGKSAQVDLGREFNNHYGDNEPTKLWGNANLSPHLPYAARIWADAWQRKEGVPVDGVIALDPSSLSGLLAATGPARMDDGTAVTSANVLDLTERSSYATFADIPTRKKFFRDVARATASQLLSATNGARMPSLLLALHHELERGQVSIWSKYAPEQRALRSMSYSGELPSGSFPFAEMVINNAAGTKLDYYLERKLHWKGGQCKGGEREVEVTLTLKNNAPRTGLPSYVTQRVDQPNYPTQPGDNRILVSYYATQGALLSSADVEGETEVAASSVERGHPVYTIDLEIPAQASRTIELRLVEPAGGTSHVLVGRQPLISPLKATVDPGPQC